MQLKLTDNTYSNINEPLLKQTETLIQPGKQTVIRIRSRVYTEDGVTGIIQPFPDLEDNDDLIICPELATTRDRQYTVLINNFGTAICTEERMPHCYFLIINARANKINQTSQSSTITRPFRHKS